MALIREVLSRNPRVLKDPAPVVGVSNLNDSEVNIAIKPWVQVADFGSASSEINLAILEEFQTRNIVMPFPQHEVRILKDENPAVAV